MKPSLLSVELGEGLRKDMPKKRPLFEKQECCSEAEMELRRLLELRRREARINLLRYEQFFQ